MSLHHLGCCFLHLKSWPHRSVYVERKHHRRVLGEFLSEGTVESPLCAALQIACITGLGTPRNQSLGQGTGPKETNGAQRTSQARSLKRQPQTNLRKFKQSRLDSTQTTSTSSQLVCCATLWPYRYPALLKYFLCVVQAHVSTLLHQFVL